MKYITITLPVCSLAALVMTTPVAQGALILRINPATQQLALFGSSTGSPIGDGSNFNPVTFQFDGASGGGFSTESFTVNTSDNFYTIDRPDANFSLRIFSVYDRVSLAFLFDSPAELTILGTGEYIDYGAALSEFVFPGDPSAAERFDQLADGTVLFVNDGTGFDDGITVEIIPEPNAAPLGLLGFLAFLRRRRS